MRSIRLVVGCALVLAIAVFAAQNRELVSLKLLVFQSANFPVGLLAIAAACAGLLTVAIVSQWVLANSGPSANARELQARLSRLERQ